MTQLHSHVAFDAHGFSVERGEYDAPPGEPLAQAIADGLTRRGYTCSDPDDSEYMWLVQVERGEQSWDLGVGLFDDSEVGQWLAFVETVGAGGGGLFRKRPPRWTVGDLTPALHAVVVEDLRATPRWYTEDEWMAGPQVAGVPAPATGGRGDDEGPPDRQ